MTKKKDEQLEKIRHSAAHVMADAVKRLYPGVKLGMGPAIEDGFYYDFDLTSCALSPEDEGKQSDRMITPEDLPEIEREMRKIAAQNAVFERKDMTVSEAEKIFSKEGETYKLEILKDLSGEKTVSIYSHLNFKDLCKGPHVENTGQIGEFKLLSVAGAYWKGSEQNAMLQRIYATAFRKKEELDEFLRIREEALKRDHRKLGREMDLFSFNDMAGAGLVIYHPKGAMLRRIISDYITTKHLEKGYELISSPQILKSDVWVKSGHYDYYKDNMYIFESEKQEYAVKPMNCPGHIMVYSSKMRSYRDLPIRYFELGNVYRHEKSGVLHGLLRVRGFTQDDAHIFCLREQVEHEVLKVIEFVDETLEEFGFSEIEVELSTMPEKHIGTEEDWKEATSALEKALKAKGITYDINEGDGAFYGPKIDIKIKDAIGRAWQCATIQCDFALPERFDLKYTADDGTEKRPVMLHRVILGSLERFMGALIEHYGGDFPLWLAPDQVRIIPIAEAHNTYAEKVEEMLRSAGLRVKTDKRDEKMQRKIRDAELEKVPYMAVVGSKEMEALTVSLRSRKNGNMGVVSIDKLIEDLTGEISSRRQSPDSSEASAAKGSS
ncbi:MAG: threonine--tRNA ligase [Candidatus Omnitrophota bacterium]